MRSTNTAVLERIATVDKAVQTDPYEPPRAREARFFVQVPSISGSRVPELSTGASPDGLRSTALDSGPYGRWVGLVTWLATGFDRRLRIYVVPEDGTTAVVRIYLVYKS